MSKNLKPPVIGDSTPLDLLMPGDQGRGFRGFFNASGGFLNFMEPLPDRYLIPEEEWPDRIADAWRDKAFPYHYAFESGPVKIKNQGSTPLCWQFATTLGLEVTRTFQNEPHVELSPASTAYQVTGGRKRGGWGGEAIEGLAQYGAVPVEYWPQTGWGRSLDTDEHRQIAADYKVVEWYYTDTIQGSVSLLLHGIGSSAGFNWWRHQVYLCGVYWPLAWLYANSWGEEYGDRGFGKIEGRRMRHAGAVCPRAALPAA